jgi:hypothetical protein
MRTSSPFPRSRYGAISSFRLSRVWSSRVWLCPAVPMWKAHWRAQSRCFITNAIRIPNPTLRSLGIGRSGPSISLRLTTVYPVSPAGFQVRLVSAWVRERPRPSHQRTINRALGRGPRSGTKSYRNFLLLLLSYSEIERFTGAQANTQNVTP